MDDGDSSVQDHRIQSLWKTLCGGTNKEGSINRDGLRAGFKRINHPLKEADDFLTDVLQRVDRNGDGRIFYSEFSAFVKHAEKELKSLFKTIDRQGNGKITREELRQAFAGAGLQVPQPKLDELFTNVDANHDGVISFEEWRDFLLFIPADTPGLKAVLSYYTTSVKLNAEGDVDVHISDETKQGAGTKTRSRSSLLRIFANHPQPRIRHRPPDSSPAPVSPTKPVAPQTTLASTKEKEHSASTPKLQETVEIHTDQASNWLTSLMVLMPVSLGYFVAGAVAGIVSRTTTAPLDRLKVYLIAQTNPTSRALDAAKDGAVVQASKHAAKPLRDAMKALWEAGGIRSLFAGNGLNVVKVMPESALKFGAYEAAKRLISKIEGHGDPQKISSSSRFIAGGLGGIISQLFSYPLDTLKFRMQCETVQGGLHGNQLIIATAKRMWANGGARPFYKGLSWGLVGQFPYSAIDLGTFEGLKRWLIKRNMRLRNCSAEEAAPGNVATASIGGFSGALGASLVYPLNLLRTRLQTQGTKEHPRTYTGIVDVTRQTIRGEGVRGLFKGITPNLIKVVPAVSITYVVYEGSKKALDLP